MNPSSPAKVGIAFAAGVVVALASAVIYIKTNQPTVQHVASTPFTHTASQPEILSPGEQKAAAPAPPLNPAPVVEPVPAVKPEETLPAEPVPAPSPRRSQAAVSRRAPVAPQPRASYPRHTSRPDSASTMRVEVSQVKPAPAYPSMAPASAPQPVPVRTVSEDQAPPVPQPAPINLPPQPNTVPLETRATASQPPQPHVVTLQAGTNLTIRLGETLSTDHNYTGDTFRATLDAPIVMDGFIIAERGSRVLGKIVAADKSGKFEGAPSLQLAITDINTTDGQRVHVQTGSISKKGQSNTRSDVEKVGAGAALGAIIGAIAGGGKGAAIGAGAGGAAGTGAVMLGKGHAAVVQNETRLIFQLSAPATITEKLN